MPCWLLKGNRKAGAPLQEGRPARLPCFTWRAQLPQRHPLPRGPQELLIPTGALRLQRPTPEPASSRSLKELPTPGSRVPGSQDIHGLLFQVRQGTLEKTER